MTHDTEDVHAGTAAAAGYYWQRHYVDPDTTHATCRRCGALIGNLTMHDAFHGISLTDHQDAQQRQWRTGLDQLTGEVT